MMQTRGTDRDIVETAIDWLEQGYAPLLVTVARTWGSSPRPAGSMMLVRDDGKIRGSVSGGCVEDDLVSRFRAGELTRDYPSLLDYGIDRAEATRLGLPCGGRLELLVERLEHSHQLHCVLDTMREGKRVARRVCLETGEVSLHEATASSEFDYAGGFASKTFGPQWVLLLIGAGHLSEYVARMGLMLDYRVIVCDPREAGPDRSGFDHCEVVTLMPDDAVAAYASHERSIVVALTHDPKLDDMALLDALTSPAFYVGAIGSQANCEKRRARLATLGVTAPQLERLHAPVGLPIGSHSPPEIAVSIMAEITALRNCAESSDHRSLRSA